MIGELRFSKYQATRNDFIMVVDLQDERPIAADAVRALCDRRAGVGADGLIRIVASERDDARFVMDYRNADGSVAEMCGNGARCIGKLVHDAKLADEMAFGIVAGAGIRRLQLHEQDGSVGRVTVEMGVPDFTKAQIPMLGPAWETFQMQRFDTGNGVTMTATALSMGNPHLVLFLDDHPDRVDVGHIGPALERHELFPERTNVEFARVLGDEIVARVWERGSGETMACGSGACAIAVAANEAGLVPAETTVRFPGGVLEVIRRTDGEVWLTGEVEHVFDGVVDLDRLDLVARA